MVHQHAQHGWGVNCDKQRGLVVQRIVHFSVFRRGSRRALNGHDMVERHDAPQRIHRISAARRFGITEDDHGQADFTIESLKHAVDRVRIMRKVAPRPDIKRRDDEEEVCSSLLGPKTLAHETIRCVAFDSGNEFE